MNLISFTFLYDTDATVSEITSVGSILISSVYPAADATLCVLERWAGISSDEHLMKDQRDLESTGVSLTHKARSRVSS